MTTKRCLTSGCTSYRERGDHCGKCARVHWRIEREEHIQRKKYHEKYMAQMTQFLQIRHDYM